MISLRRLLPDPAEVTVDAQIAGLALAERAPDDRPYVVANMVSTADGKAAIAGRTGAIGDEADRQVFHHLRTQADAVLAGTRTLRTERYGRLVRDPGLREKREREGLAPDPLACVISLSGNLPLDIPLFQDPDSEIVVYTAAEGPVGAVPARVTTVNLPADELTPVRVLRHLRAEHGVRSVLCEGGPTLNASLLEDAALDELFLTVAPKLAGGAGALTIVAGRPFEPPEELELTWALEAAGSLFLRYEIHAAAAAPRERG